MQPSELLEKAARIIDERAAEATPGVWSGETTLVYNDASDAIVETWNPTDATWIALISPAIAPYLAALFRAMKKEMDWRTNAVPDHEVEAWHAPVLAFARAIIDAAEGQAS